MSMIKNQIILDKIKDKTDGSPTMEKFLMEILEIEVQNKHHTKPYKNYITKYAPIHAKEAE